LRYLLKIKLILISHIHADHHLGLIQILSLRIAIAPHLPPLLIIGPTSVHIWLAEIAPIFSFSFIFLDAQLLCEKFSTSLASLSLTTPSSTKCPPLLLSPEELIQNTLPLYSIVSVFVPHCHLSYAYVLSLRTERAPFKLVYSGDTRPSMALVRAGMGADILIHEATFENGMKEEAARKMHCSFGDALGVATAMNAKCTFLFHFSQRYPKIPIFDFCDDVVEFVEMVLQHDNTILSHTVTVQLSAERRKKSRVFVAFDLMHVEYNLLELVSCYSKVLKLLELEASEDNNDEKEIDQKSQKKSNQPRKGKATSNQKKK
jgi:ribonuclease BN (tRNA processing enzyme)